MGLVLNFIVDEGLSFEEEFINQSINHVFINDYIDSSDSFLDYEALYVVLCFDTEELKPSIHSLPFFSSFCDVNGVLYGTDEDGIHKLDGDTDNGQTIHTGVAWTKTSFNLSNKKKFRAAILEGEVDDAVLQAETDGKYGLYSVIRNRASMARNLIGRDWDIRIIDFDRLEAIELVPIVGRR